jgi:hypothetical protein
MPPAPPRRLHARPGAFPQPFPFILGHGRQQRQHAPAHRGLGIEAFRQGKKPDAAPVEIENVTVSSIERPRRSSFQATRTPPSFRAASA